MGPNNTSTCKGCQRVTIVQYRDLCGICLDEALGSARIHVIQALKIMTETGGSMTCTPGENRRWKVKNSECACESINLTLACRSFVRDYEDSQQGILS